MRKTALMLALAVAMPAWAQTPADKAAEDKPAAQQQEAEKAPTKAQKKSSGRKHSRRTEDARHCLDKPTNTEIIKCAEAYL
jgi:hypothetical protein